MEHSFKKFISNYTYLSIKEWPMIESRLERIDVKKGDHILKAGTVCKHLYFLEKGFLRYYNTENDSEITKYFTEAPYAFTSQESFSNHKPATENVEAIEDSVVWSISYKDTHDLLELQSWSTFIRKMVQEVQKYTEKILVQTQSETAESRYQKMLENFDPIVARVPLKYLASYLGIAPQSLSEIRKKLIRGYRS